MPKGCVDQAKGNNIDLITAEHMQIINDKRANTEYVAEMGIGEHIKGVRDAQKLTKEEYELLLLCDGNTEIEENELVVNLIARAFISPCNKGERTLDPWQRRDCDNRYFLAMNWMITGKCN